MCTNKAKNTGDFLFVSSERFYCFGKIFMKRLENEFLVRCLKFPHIFLSLGTQDCSSKCYGEDICVVEQYVSSIISMSYKYEIY